MAAQASLCLAWSETPEDTFCRVMAHINVGNVVRSHIGTSVDEGNEPGSSSIQQYKL